MKTALIHDFLVEYGGAERVLETLHEMFPQAPIYTALYDRSGPGMKRFSQLDIRQSFLQKLPASRFLLSPFRLFALKFFEGFDLSSYDLIISSTWMYMAKGVKVRPGALHISYIHTPPRFLYGYPTARNWRKYWWGRVAGNLLNHRLRVIDFQASQKPEHLIANSKFTAGRIKKFYRREATVIYPPARFVPPPRSPSGPPRRSDFARASQGKTSDGGAAGGGRLLRGWGIGEPYFLCVSRLARVKRIDLAIKACNQLNLNLFIVGAGREEKYLRSIGGPKIKFLGHLTDQELAKVYAGCRAVIFPAEDEDFGIVPVEAMSFGKPVIALRSGGVVETVIDGKTGLFFDKPTVNSLVKSLKKFKSLRFKTSDCRAQAQKFSKQRFKKEIKKFIASLNFDKL